MIAMKTVLALLLGLGLFLLVGCCETRTLCARPSAPPPCGGAGGALAFRLAGGMTTNSSSVKTSGFRSRCPDPVARGCWTPGVGSPCNSYGPTPGAVPPCGSYSPAPAFAAPADCCPDGPIVSTLFPSDGNLESDYITLPEGGGDVEIYAFVDGVLEKAGNKPEEALPEAVGVPVRAEELVPAAPAGLVPVTPEELIAVTPEAVVEAPAEKPEGPPTLPAVDDMPPVFREGANDGAADEVLSSVAPSTEPLPQVELPPELK